MPKMDFTDRLKPKEVIEPFDVKDKVVIVRVEDPVAYSQTSGAQMTKLMMKAGAVFVMFAKPSDKLEALSDEDLKALGLKRIEECQ